MIFEIIEIIKILKNINEFEENGNTHKYFNRINIKSNYCGESNISYYIALSKYVQNIIKFHLVIKC